MSPILVVFLLPILYAQGLEDVGKPDHNEMVADIKELLASAVTDMKADVNGKLEQLKTLVKTETQEGLESIDSKYDYSREQIRNMDAPQDCLGSADKFLEKSRLKTSGSFFSCPNITVAVKDVVNITFVVGKLGVNLLLSADDILNGLSGCFSFNPFHIVPCVYRYIKTALVDVYVAFKELRQFTTEVGNLVEDIKKQIKSCTGEAHDLAHADTITAFKHIHHCTQSTKHVQLH